MAKIYYHAVPADWRKEQKYKFLDEHDSVSKIDWTEITPDAKQNWLTAGMEKEFDTFIQIGDKDTKGSETVNTAIFKSFSIGVSTNRDNWVYNYRKDTLTENIEVFIGTYNGEIARLRQRVQKKEKIDIDEFVLSDEKRIKWSSRLKECLSRFENAEYAEEKIRFACYRPFSSQFLYFDRILNHRVSLFPRIFPTPNVENTLICVGGYGRKSFSLLATKQISDMNFYGDPQKTFSFYIYDEDSTNRRENITDWALTQFREHYGATPLSEPGAIANGFPGAEDKSPVAIAPGSDKKASAITKWDIFYYTYAILHHPEYRDKYAANLKRELPRIPFAPDFWSFAKAGKELADIHVGYEDQPEHKLDMIESGKLALDWSVERMKYNKDKTAIIYNDFLTIDGIPPEVHEYRLGNRSALDWIVDQYKVSIDKRSGITNDPNRDDDPQYIVRLIKKIVTVSLRTNEIVKSLPALVEA